MKAFFGWLNGRVAFLATQIWKLGSWVYQIIQIFLGTDGAKETVKTSAKVATANAVFRGWEYTQFLATATIVSFLKYYGVPEILIFVLLWLTNMGICFSELHLYNKTKVDFTLAAGFRRATDSLLEKSFMAGAVIEILFTIRLILYDGASQFLIYNERRFESTAYRIAAFVTTSVLQMGFWTWLLSRGYDNLFPYVKDLILSLF